MVDLRQHRDRMVETAMLCSLCMKQWIAHSHLDAVLPFECPACRAMAGLPRPVAHGQGERGASP